MKKLKLVLTFLMILTLPFVHGQQKQKSVRSGGGIDTDTTPTGAIQCGPGLYPNGNNCYPCLGCHPCGNTYCDNNSKIKAISINQIDIPTLITDVEGGSTIISKKDLKRLIIENSVPAESASKENNKKVKCGCGTNIYGKDEAACQRICKFLGSTASSY